MTHILHWGFFKGKPGLLFGLQPILPAEPSAQGLSAWRYHATPVQLTGLQPYVFITKEGAPHGACQMPMAEEEVRRLINLMKSTETPFSFPALLKLIKALGFPVLILEPHENYPVILL